MNRLKLRGITDLYLVSGGVPHFKEMVELAGPIANAITNEYGTIEFLKRLSNPYFFSSFACVLGFEYNTSGQTTITLLALKQALEKENIGVMIAGGKGKLRLKIPEEIEKIGNNFNISTQKIEQTKYASKISAKVDSSALQDLNGNIYFHSIILNEKANYTIIQQKMAIEEQLARRYHWFQPENLVIEPHSGIIGNKQEIVLDLTANKADSARNMIVDIAKENPLRLNEQLKEFKQSTFKGFLRKLTGIQYLNPPKKLNQKVLETTKNAKNFEELLAIKGVGPATIRGLSYIASLVYGTEPSWKDPAKYEWAFGTKTGRPYFVKRNEMCKVANILKTAIENAKIGNKEKIEAIRRLKDFLPKEI